MQKDTNNNKSEKQQNQAEKLLQKAEEQRRKIENATEEEAKKILQEAEETDRQVEEARKQIAEELAKAIQEYKQADAKVKRLLAEAEALDRASKEAKATTSAVLETVANLQSAIYEIIEPLSEIDTIKEQIAKECAAIKKQMANVIEVFTQRQNKAEKEIAKMKRWLYVAIAIGVLAWIMK